MLGFWGKNSGNFVGLIREKWSTWTSMFWRHGSYHWYDPASRDVKRDVAQPLHCCWWRKALWRHSTTIKTPEHISDMIQTEYSRNFSRLKHLFVVWDKYKTTLVRFPRLRNTLVMIFCQEQDHHSCVPLPQKSHSGGFLYGTPSVKLGQINQCRHKWKSADNPHIIPPTIPSYCKSSVRGYMYMQVELHSKYCGTKYYWSGP